MLDEEYLFGQIFETGLLWCVGGAEWSIGASVKASSDEKFYNRIFCYEHNNTIFCYEFVSFSYMK